MGGTSEDMAWQGVEKISDSPEETLPQDILNSEKTCIHFLNKESFIQHHSLYTLISTEKEWHTVFWNVSYNIEHHDHLLSKAVK